MRLELSRLVLVKRYLWGSLVVAIVPLVLLAALYDRYSTDLLDNLVVERIDGELEATSVKMESFINTHVKRLENIIDLPEVADSFADAQDKVLSSQLIDLLYLEVENPDIYGVEFLDSSGQRLRAIPHLSEQLSSPDYSQLPHVQSRRVEIIGPILPENGRPGWFLLRKPVLRESQVIGALALKVRLASLTELASSLYRRGVYEPRILINEDTVISVVGTPADSRQVLASSREFVPNWRVALVNSGKDIEQPLDRIRYALLFFTLLSGIGVVWLFVHMSERLARMITPLNEGAKSIARGDFSVRVSEDGPGELKSLARSFNEMSSHLDAMIISRVDVDRRAVLGNLAAGIAHEIRNPLATVRTSIHGLRITEKDPERAELYQVIVDEIMRIDEIVEEFLIYARPRDSRKEPTPARDVFNGIQALMSSTALEHDVKLNILVDPSLVLYVDPGQFRQILMNLMLNAIQAIPDGGVLTLRANSNGNMAEIVIEDTGVGIEEANLAKVKVPFFTTKRRGTGLGLAICAQLLRANEGELEIESTPGIGTRVTVKIPIVMGEGSNE